MTVKYHGKSRKDLICKDLDHLPLIRSDLFQNFQESIPVYIFKPELLQHYHFLKSKMENFAKGGTRISLDHEKNTYPSRSSHAPWYNVPQRSVVSVEHPFIIRNVGKAVESLGGSSKMQDVRGSDLLSGAYIDVRF